MMYDLFSCVPTGFIAMKVYRRGILIDAWTERNLVVGNAATLVAQLLGGTFTGNSISQVGFGSNISPPAPGNTSLSDDAYIKPLDGVSYPSPTQIAFAFSMDPFEANGRVIAEYGLLTGSGGLFARLARSAPLTKDATMSLQATWFITFPTGA